MIYGVCRHGLGGNLYSTGMDKLCAELNKVTPAGVHFTVSGGDDPRFDEAQFDEGLLNMLAKGTTVIYTGHSLGADAAIRFADLAKSHGYKLPLICPIDPVCWDTNATIPGIWEIGDNVSRVVSYRSVTFPGGGLVRAKAGNTTTQITDVQLQLPHATMPGGLDIASSPQTHQAVIAAVLAVVNQ